MVVDACQHARKIQRQTYVEVWRGKWMPSSLEWKCLDCGDYGVNTPKEAFASDAVRRRIELMRDDDGDAERC